MKAELEEDKTHKVNEQAHMASVLQTESLLGAKRIALTDLPRIAEEREELLKYVKQKNLLDDQGKLKG